MLRYEIQVEHKAMSRYEIEVELEAQNIVEVRKPRLAGIAWAKLWRGADLMQSHVETLQLLMPTMFSDHREDDNSGDDEDVISFKFLHLCD